MILQCSKYEELTDFATTRQKEDLNTDTIRQTEAVKGSSVWKVFILTESSDKQRLAETEKRKIRVQAKDTTGMQSVTNIQSKKWTDEVRVQKSDLKIQHDTIQGNRQTNKTKSGQQLNRWPRLWKHNCQSTRENSRYLYREVKRHNGSQVFVCDWWSRVRW